MVCLTIKQALEMFEVGLEKMRAEQPLFVFYVGKSYQIHSCLVACCAEIIASRLEDIDDRKAHILGLLHDYGKLQVTGIGFSKIKDRMLFIKDKYRVSTLIIKKKYREALKLKNYFDKLCGCDIYQLLGIKE